MLCLFLYYVQDAIKYLDLNKIGLIIHYQFLSCNSIVCYSHNIGIYICNVDLKRKIIFNFLGRRKISKKEIYLL